MKHFTAFHLVVAITFTLTAAPLAASAQDEVAGIIETNGYTVDTLYYLADTTDDLADELAGIIETNGYVAPEELTSFDETLGYVLDDLASEADAICARALAGGGGIGLEGDGSEIAVMALGTGAIGLTGDASEISVMALGTGAINLTGGAAEIAIMAMGTGAIGLEDDDIALRPRGSGSVSRIVGGEWIGASVSLCDVLHAVAASDLPEGDAHATAQTARQLAALLDQVARGLETM